jgi:hypothetical protein
MLRLISIGDIHGFHRKLILPPGDILIHSGDFDGGSIQAVDNFNAWLGTPPCRHKLVIAGNRDLLFDRHPKLARAHLTKAIYLMGEDWAFCRERGSAIRKHWERIPVDTDVLITHEAPYGTLDKNDILGRHHRCHNLLGALLRVKPRLHVFGHIHGGYGRKSA